MRKLVILLAGTLLSLTSFAQSNFKCVVIDGVTLNEHGVLTHTSNVARMNIGKEFVVNRATGQVTGGGLTNTMSDQMPVVLDYLPDENGYKAVTIYKPNPTVDYLQINEYASGKAKPFFWKGAWGAMLSGTCVHY